MRLRVSGDTDDDKFLGMGRLIYADIKRTAILGGKPLQECRDILDFGCGPARVLRFFPPRSGLVGVDIDQEAIGWASEHLNQMAAFHVGPVEPPLSFESASFDLIFAVSVWTHLPADMGDRWMNEMHRILRPDGLLIPTFLGESTLRSVWPDGLTELQSNGIFYAKTPTTGLPNFYGLTFHVPSFVEARWAPQFKMTGYYPCSIGTLQDAATLRKQPL
jgi:SAM-dependent methyltransferase